MKKIHANVAESTLTAVNDRRSGMEALRGRVDLLTGTDRLMMTMYLENGNTFYQMAKLAGVHETTIARRIHRITKRLTDGQYIMCLRNRDKFTKAEMDIARDYLLGGLSMRKIADRQNISFYRVHRTIKKVRACTRLVRDL